MAIIDVVGVNAIGIGGGVVVGTIPSGSSVGGGIAVQ